MLTYIDYLFSIAACSIHSGMLAQAMTQAILTFRIMACSIVTLPIMRTRKNVTITYNDRNYNRCTLTATS
jgi:hypothetical protein